MRIFLALFVALQVQAQQWPDLELCLISAVRAKVAENLKKLPNYTCTQAVVRLSRAARTGHSNRLDTIHLDVVYVDGKELFGAAGSSAINQAEARKIVTGTFSNGNFALLEKSVFLGGTTTFRYRGLSKLGNKTVIHFDYRVPRGANGYQLQSGSTAAIVGFHGSFWIDSTTLGLVRLVAFADDIPNALKLRSVVDRIDFNNVSIGKSIFLLPRSAQLEVRDTYGNESQNRTRLQSCHEFAAESAVSFDSIPVESFTAPPR